eukprot:CAMPEP_0176434472 /NCGR_PEP_ID=MMETSP0127-20121128/16698_1 /TAXON_ID=938130 /ORGANISM="Platyophrya macrostoma, Strain WH" /LENGTH=348 /DNA_ID=CAMNT_0017817217 /DNA_START=113 /DNA_END=1159 /DNA_ORIENTATION=-
MTRCRADPKTGIPNDLHVKYYSERAANAGFVLTECTAISNQGNSFPGATGIWNREQVDGWKKVCDAVHEKGGKIILQIWHGGRAATTDKTGETPLAPSPIAMRGFDKEGNTTEDQVPTEMTIEDIKKVKEEFRQGALRAKEAGFDGIQLHGANGYLVDQFIRDGTNKRTDEYGGSIENRARFCLEVMDELISVFGADRCGIKFSPVGRYQDMYDSTPLETFSYILKKFDEKGVAFVEFTEASSYEGKSHYAPGKDQIAEVAKSFRGAFKGTLITNQGHTPETALDFINKGYADLVTFAKLYISNPDLALRIKNGWEINTKQDFTTFFTPGEKGYTDYPHYNPETATGK